MYIFFQSLGSNGSALDYHVELEGLERGKTMMAGCCRSTTVTANCGRPVTNFELYNRIF